MLYPVKAGLIPNLAKPGGNPDRHPLDAGHRNLGKAPGDTERKPFFGSHAAFLGMREGWEGCFGQFWRDAADRLGISLISVLPQNGLYRRSSAVFAEMAQQRRTRC